MQSLYLVLALEELDDTRKIWKEGAAKDHGEIQ